MTLRWRLGLGPEYIEPVNIWCDSNNLFSLSLNIYRHRVVFFDNVFRWLVSMSEYSLMILNYS